MFLLIAYPVQMTTWPLPVNGSFDVLSGATPLAAVKQGLAGPGAIGVQEMLLGNIPVRWARWPLRPCCADSSTCCGGA